MKNFWYSIFVVFAFYACNASKEYIFSQVEIDRGASMYADYTLANLKEGQSLYMANCGSCHGLKDPTSHTTAEWKRIVPQMAEMINKMEVKLDVESQDLILKYVTVMGTATPENEY
ncbi:MAG: cytochrome c5 [Salibacteraceae bacterium]|jgi:cytochrome c5